MRAKVNFRYEFKGMEVKEPIMVEAVVDDVSSAPEFELLSLKFSEIEGEDVDIDNSLCIADMAPAMLEIMNIIGEHLVSGRFKPE